MNKVIALFLLFIISITQVLAKEDEQFEDKEFNSSILEKPIGGVYTFQPYEVELLDYTTAQTVYSMTLKVANKINLLTSKVGDKFLLVLPSDVNLEKQGKIPAGTKFSATIVQKEKTKSKTGIFVKFIVNEIIFTDTKDFILLSNPKNIAPLKTISAERILGKNAKVHGTFRLGTVIKEVESKAIKMKPATTTAVGICVKAYPNPTNYVLKAGTAITFTFESSIKPEVMYR